MNGLTRPVGPAKIVKTEVRTPDVLVARLSGAVRTEVATVRCGKRMFFCAPERLGGVREVPAWSLTEGLHAAIWDLNDRLSASPKGKARQCGK